ncbi:MAG: alpha-L-fucosidase [Rhodanobacter sp. 68-29]|nr:alpha-L-fucosidase [Rhodanobacter sp.]ODU76139.1 MAG: alpha-L-fucosidase [Rhodanobacter sp. SCN 69-32]OJY62354.1 MAG: alpha-L-fucosidase [Rhodanobacter sp. 68-29]
MDRRRFLLAGSAAASLGALGLPRLVRADAAATATPTAPRPRPTPQQLRWQREELAMFVHLTVNTFTDKEWGDGAESPSIFNPRKLDAGQWARAAKQAGFRSMILTAKHHDGFCLWPTATTAHSVKNSPWKDGHGDVVREYTDACRAEGLGAGLYLSPWDRNAKVYGSGEAYNDFYIAQLTELLTHYGRIVEVWFDGANGEGPDGRRQAYDWPRIHATVRRLQPDAIIYSDAGPDVRWVGNEKGVAGSTCWTSIDPASVPYAGYDRPWVGELLGHGDPHGSVWRPTEADVSIRPGWFWHPAENDKVRTADDLLDLYFSSVGHNGKLTLSLPPNRDGLFDATDIASLQGFAAKRTALFASDLLQGARVRASGSDAPHLPAKVLEADPDTYWSAPPNARDGWLEFELPQEIEFDTLELGEAIALGQNIANYRVELWDQGAWRQFAWGTTIGNRKLARFDPVRAGKLRVALEFGYGTPRLARVAAYRGPDRRYGPGHDEK